MTPVFALFLGYPAYLAVGISLGADVFASLVSSLSYFRHKNVNLKDGLPMIGAAVLGAVFGSFFSNSIAGPFIIFGTNIFVLFLGIQLLRKPIHLLAEELNEKWDFRFFEKRRALFSVIIGFVLGILAGVFGGGGGLMIFLVLVFVLKYSVKVAVGTSVFLMIFVALFGSLSHFYYASVQAPYAALAVSSIGSVIGALLSSRYANLISEEKLSKIIGLIIFVLGIFLLLKYFFE